MSTNNVLPMSQASLALFYNNFSGLNSGFYVNFGHSNYEYKKLFPSGSSPITFNGLNSTQSYAEINIKNMHIQGSFWGGSNGYYTNYYYN